MAGERIFINGVVAFIDYADGEGSAVVNGRQWRWEFHEFTGPSFLRKDGEPMRKIPGEKHPVWDAFNEWLKEWRKKHPRRQRKNKAARTKLEIS